MFECRVQLVLNVLDEVVDLLQLVVLGLSDLIDCVLHLMHVLVQLLQSLFEHLRFLLNDVAVLVVDVFEPHELMALVFVAAEHVALGANGHFARLAEIVHADVVLLAELSTIFEDRTIF